MAENATIHPHPTSIRPFSLSVNFLVDDDIDDFNEYLEPNEFLDFGEAGVFDTEAQVPLPLRSRLWSERDNNA